MQTSALEPLPLLAFADVHLLLVLDRSCTQYLQADTGQPVYQVCLPLLRFLDNWVHPKVATCSSLASCCISMLQRQATQTMSVSARRILVTGASKGGLGWEAARQLLQQGHELVLTLRDERKAKEAVDALAASGAPRERVHTVLMDLSRYVVCGVHGKTSMLAFHVHSHMWALLHTGIPALARAPPLRPRAPAMPQLCISEGHWQGAAAALPHLGRAAGGSWSLMTTRGVLEHVCTTAFQHCRWEARRSASSTQHPH